MAHYLFNLAEQNVAQVPTLREIADGRLRVGMWGVDADEPHREDLAPGDLILIYLAEPERAFIGQAVLASAVREWTPSEAQAYPGDSPSGVLISDVEEWDQPLPMDTVVPRIDPGGTNPLVQANATAGFQAGVVRITAGEYETVQAVRAERRAGESAFRTDVLIDGVRTSVLVSGPDGDEAVVFLHGNPGSGHDWKRLIGPAAGFVRCVAPDMPGYGASDKPRDFDYSADGYGRHLDRLLNTLGVRRAHLVAHDLGGPWGLAWAASRPAQLASLTFMSIGVLPGYRWHRYARLYRVPIVGELLLTSAAPNGVRPVLQRGSQVRVPDAFVDEVVSQYHDPGTRRAVLSFYRATNDLGLTTVSQAERVGRPDVPTLVLWGAGDPYVPASYAEVQRQFFPSARVVVLRDSGHWPLVDDPESVVAEIIPFLRAHVSAKPASRAVAKLT